MTTRHLFIAPDNVRDALRLQPVVQQHQQDHADAQLDVLASADVAPVLDLVPQFADVLMIAPGALGQVQQTPRIADILRRRQYSHCFNYSGHALAGVAAWMTRIPVRERRTLPASGLPAPRLVPPPDAVQWVQRQLDEHGGETGAANAPLIVLTPGAPDAARRWPTRHYATLVNLLSGHWPDAQIVLAGNAADRPLGTEIATLGAAPFLNLAGQMSMAQQVAVMRAADVVVCTDSANFDLAGASTRQLVAIYGPTSRDDGLTLNAQVQAMSLKLTCSPCNQPVCPKGHGNCLNLMEPVRIFNAIERAVRATGPLRPVQ